MVIEPVANLPLLIPFFKIQTDFKHFGSQPNRLRVSKFTKVVASLSSVTGFAQDEQGAHGYELSHPGLLEYRHPRSRTDSNLPEFFERHDIDRSMEHLAQGSEVAWFGR